MRFVLQVSFHIGCYPGSSHDSTAFSMSALSTLLERSEDTLLPGYWIAADGAYTCSNRLLCPWPGRNISQEFDCFNYWQSSALIFIEQAIDILFGRWDIFWRTIRTKLQKITRIIEVTAKLHIFIIDESGDCSVPRTENVDFAHHNTLSDANVYLQDDCDRDEEAHRRRRDLDVSDI